MRASIAREPVTDEYAGELEMVVLSAFDAVVVHGHGTRREWDCLARALNHSWVLASNGIGAEAAPVLERAKEAMRRARDRFTNGGRIGFDGEGNRDLRAALDLWGEQLRMCTVGEVDAATRAVEKHYWSVPA
ncbi:hypothetical protein [Pandoraea communis]|nr:hypothetical protein [Pandoraea communis]